MGEDMTTPPMQLARRRGLLRAVVILTAFLGLVAALGLKLPQQTAAGSPDSSTGDDGSAIRRYLLAHPEVILEAIERWQAAQQKAVQENQARRIGAVWPELANDGFSPVIGPADAPVTVIEYYDYRCPYCRRAHRDSKRLIQEFKGRIRYVFKQFPVIDRPGEPAISAFASKGAVAAYRQGCFPAYHDALMEASGGLSKERILKLAEKAGCDIARLKRDMADPAIANYLEQTIAHAHTIGIAGTPTYVINRRLLEGAVGWKQLKAAVEESLKEAGAGREKGG
ncbi:MAG: DsbA family protein [Alphaproteobacteria bacterium]|nr:MAG: DsbA family protein [Alphaproteobacteria bacterium]